ncbi:MAG: type I-E CRISPR-associated protein Cas6/Cse3/CasE [Myxococcota bacterium]
MYLTRVFLDPSSQAVQLDLGTPESLHKTVMRAFPNEDGPTARARGGVLYRLEREADGRIVLLIQSANRPTPNRWPPGYALDLASDPDLALVLVGGNPAVREVTGEFRNISEGRCFGFRLCANTTRKIATKTGPDGKRQNGRRVPVRGDALRAQWLRRRAEGAGFAVDEASLRITEVAPNSHVGPKSITMAGTIFEGALVVRNAQLFRSALAFGIGPGKAYGFGLLSLRPLRGHCQPSDGTKE